MSKVFSGPFFPAPNFQSKIQHLPPPSQIAVRSCLLFHQPTRLARIDPSSLSGRSTPPPPPPRSNLLPPLGRPSLPRVPNSFESHRGPMIPPLTTSEPPLNPALHGPLPLNPCPEHARLLPPTCKVVQCAMCVRSPCLSISHQPGGTRAR